MAFFHAKGSGRVVNIPPKGLAPPGVGWKCVKAWYGTREASKCWDNEAADTLIKEGCKAVVVAPMMFVSENQGYVTVCHGDDCFEWESNSKHVEDMVELCGLKLGSEGAPTPITKVTGKGR